MKKILIYSLFFIPFFTACNNNDTTGTAASENDVDAARNFIKASLERNWSEAKKYMLQDSANIERLEKIESFYVHENSEDKRGYREASINMYESRKLNDSITIVNYSNSYKNKKDSLMVVRSNDKWLVDLKYSFLPIDSVKHAQ